MMYPHQLCRSNMPWLLFVLLLLTMCNLCFIAKAYKNPVQGFQDSPDPGVIYDEGTKNFYALTTGGSNGHAFPIWQSSNLVKWIQKGWGLQSYPSWAKDSFWAPEVHIVNKRYVLYYTARTSSGKLCIGAAYSVHILGPYIDLERPLHCQDDMGIIDATFHVENGKNFLIYKTDGNAIRMPTQIYAIQMDANGLAITGERIFLFKNTLQFEGTVVEAPWVLFKNDYYYIFYSVNGYYDKSYSVSVARSKNNLLGPYEKYNQTILHTKNPESANSPEGPGHCSVLLLKSGEYYMVYHAWPHAKAPQKRFMMLDKITWKDDWPYIGQPSEDDEPDPKVSVSLTIAMQ